MLNPHFLWNTSLRGNYYLREFTGSEYYLIGIKTVGDLKEALRKMIDVFRSPYPTLEYVLKDSIPFLRIKTHFLLKIYLFIL